MIKEFFKDKIKKLKEQNLHRTPKSKKDKLISFCSNDYLGLAQNKKVKKAAIEATKKYGFGSTASRYIFTNHNLHETLEKTLSDLKNTDDTIIFGSGYLAGTSAIAALIDKGDLILADKLIHSSLIDGAKLSGAKMLRFKHNDVNHAKEILEKQRKDFKKCLIITETVFSMDGDLGKIDELLELALKHNCLLLSDDAHGIGIVKNKYPQKYKEIHLQLGTLSKGVGGYGGYVCSSKNLIDYLRNFARSSIYSTALPPSILAGNIESLKIIKEDKKLGKKALENANYFCQLLNLEATKSCIVPIIIGDVNKTLKISQEIEKAGFLISAIRPPTVEKNKSRLRITFNSNNKKSDIKKLSYLLTKLNN